MASVWSFFFLGGGVGASAVSIRVELMHVDGWHVSHSGRQSSIVSEVPANAPRMAVWVASSGSKKATMMLPGVISTVVLTVQL